MVEEGFYEERNQQKKAKIIVRIILGIIIFIILFCIVLIYNYTRTKRIDYKLEGLKFQLGNSEYTEKISIEIKGTFI